MHKERVSLTRKIWQCCIVLTCPGAALTEIIVLITSEQVKVIAGIELGALLGSRGMQQSETQSRNKDLS